jgi:hypothetical protein
MEPVKFRDLFQQLGMTPSGWQIGFPYVYGIAQITASSLKLFLC